MKESEIINIFEMLIDKIIIPKYPFLELFDIKKPSESINPMATVFYTIFTTSKELDYRTVKEIQNDVNDLFKSAGFSTYNYRDYHYGVRVEIRDKKSEKL